MNHLTIDIGNTDSVFGIWSAGVNEPNVLRINTGSLLAREEPGFHKLASFLNLGSLDQSTQIIISSVVPRANEFTDSLVKEAPGTTIRFLNQSTFERLPLDILRPEQIGADLVANALAAHTLYHEDCIVVDFGTAMSFTTIDSQGKIIGVSIAPGLQTALRSLTSNAAQLFEVPLEMPSSALGKDTEHAIQSGIMYGYDGLIRGIINAQEKELGLQLLVIATGGLSQKIPTLRDRVNHYEPYLTLLGLKIAGNYI